MCVCVYVNRWWCSLTFVFFFIPQTFGKKIWSSFKPSYFSTEQCKDLVCLGSIYKGLYNPVMSGLYITNIGSLLKNQCNGQYEDVFVRGSTGLHKKPPNEKMAWKTSTQLKDIPRLRLEITKKNIQHI